MPKFSLRRIRLIRERANAAAAAGLPDACNELRPSTIVALDETERRLLEALAPEWVGAIVSYAKRCERAPTALTYQRKRVVFKEELAKAREAQS